ncbi:hypothetical protein FRC08_010466 [Ceratobasidium sp. 394]|nr:hypothetical protein FRC08_010466 [Ceratobasidium sp. 394]
MFTSSPLVWSSNFHSRSAQCLPRYHTAKSPVACTDTTSTAFPTIPIIIILILTRLLLFPPLKCTTWTIYPTTSWFSARNASIVSACAPTVVGHGYGCTACPGPITRPSTPRGVASVSVRRSNIHPRSKHPCSIRRPKHSKIQHSRSLTDIHTSSALAPSPLRNCAAYDEVGALVPVSARVGPVYEPLEAVPRPGMHTSPSMVYPATTPYPIQTPLTARQGYLQTPPTITTRALHSPVVTPITSIMVTRTCGSAISPVSPIRARFGFPMTHAPPIAAFGEGTRLARDPEIEMEDGIEDADVHTEIGSPEIGEEEELRLPPIRTLPPVSLTANQWLNRRAEQCEVAAPFRATCCFTAPRA